MMAERSSTGLGRGGTSAVACGQAKCVATRNPPSRNTCSCRTMATVTRVSTLGYPPARFGCLSVRKSRKVQVFSYFSNSNFNLTSHTNQVILAVPTPYHFARSGGRDPLGLPPSPPRRGEGRNKRTRATETPLPVPRQHGSGPLVTCTAEQATNLRSDLQSRPRAFPSFVFLARGAGRRRERDFVGFAYDKSMASTSTLPSLGNVMLCTVLDGSSAKL